MLTLQCVIAPMIHSFLHAFMNTLSFQPCAQAEARAIAELEPCPELATPADPPFSDVFRFGDSDSLQRVDAIDFPEKAMPMCLRSSAGKGLVPALLPLDIFIDTDIGSCAPVGTLLLADPTDVIARRHAIIS